MKSDASVKRFDCVACMREARERISAKISSMSHEEFRRWVNSSIAEDPILASFAVRHRDPAERGTYEGAQ